MAFHRWDSSFCFHALWCFREKRCVQPEFSSEWTISSGFTVGGCRLCRNKCWMHRAFPSLFFPARMTKTLFLLRVVQYVDINMAHKKIKVISELNAKTTRGFPAWRRPPHHTHNEHNVINRRQSWPLTSLLLLKQAQCSTSAWITFQTKQASAKLQSQLTTGYIFKIKPLLTNTLQHVPVPLNRCTCEIFKPTTGTVSRRSGWSSFSISANSFQSSGFILSNQTPFKILAL